MSTSPSNLSKRKRLDVSDGDIGETKGTAIVRSSVFWFDDGSVVLQVENTQLCVHRSILCLHSKTFQEMFSVPQPDVRETVDGRPLVNLFDKLEDWENVLGVLYHGTRSHNNPAECPVDVLISILRLSHKYMLDDSKTTAVRRLKKEFPDTHYEWLEREKKHQTMLSIRGYEIDLINVALELQLNSVLPILFYILLRDGEPAQIFDGVVRKDGTVASLPTHIQRTLTLGRNKILDAIMAHPYRWTTAPHHTGALRTCCVADRHGFLQSIAPDLSHNLHLALDPVGGVESWIQDLDFCADCTEYVTLEMMTGFHAIWQKIPSYFELPSWDVLRTSVDAD